MMTSQYWTCSFGCFVALVVNLPASAAELTLSIVRASDGASSVTVLPGTTVNYEIRGVLSSSSDNGGLAFWSADLEFDEDALIGQHGGIATPGSAPMDKFVKNAGFSNPAGYGGTAVSGKLVQIGGGQNTIDNDPGNAPYPAGEVTLNVAHSTVVLATGSYPVPSEADLGEQHVLKLTGCLASAIDAGDTDAPYASHAVKANCGSAVLTIGTPPEATVTDAVSRYANVSGPGGVCDLALMPSVKSEPRNTRVAEVRVTFDMAPGNPSGSSGTGVTLEQKVCPAPGTYAAYSGSAVVSYGVSGNTLVLGFSPALENARTYKINLGDLVTATSGQSIEVRGLIGDVDNDGNVGPIDRSIVVGVWSGSGFSCSTDLDNSGATNALDRAIVVGAWTGTQYCAP